MLAPGRLLVLSRDGISSQLSIAPSMSALKNTFHVPFEGSQIVERGE